MTLAQLFTPSFLVSLAFFLFIVLFGKKLFGALCEKAREHQEFVQKPFQEIQMLLQEAQDVLQEEKEKREERKLQEKNIETLSKLEVKAIQESLKKILQEEKNTAETFYQQHVHAIILQWKKERMQELFHDFQVDVHEKIKDSATKVSVDFGGQLLEKSRERS